MMKKWLLMVGAGALFLGTVASSQDDANPVPETAPVESPLSGLRMNVNAPTLDGESLSVILGRRIQRGGRAIYVPPFFQFDHRAYRNHVNSACSEAEADEKVSVPVRFRLASSRVNDEVLEAVSTNHQSADIANVLSYPYAFLTLSFFDTSDRVNTLTHVATLPTGIMSGINDQTQGVIVDDRDFYFEQRVINVSLTCVGHKKIVDRDATADFVFRAYTNVQIINSSSFSIDFVNFAKSFQEADLIQNQRNRGMVRFSTSTRAGQIGFNFGSVLGQAGGSNSSGATVDSRSRYVSANLVKARAEAFASQLAVQSIISAGGQTGIANRQAIIDRLFDGFLAAAETEKVRFQKNADGTWTLLSDAMESLTLNASQVNELIETSGDSQTSSERSASYAGASASQNDSFTDDRKIKWQRQGGEWIPVEADLYLVGNMQSSSRFFSTLDDIVLTGDTSLQILPLRVIASNSLIPEKVVYPLRAGRFRTVSSWAGGNIDAAANRAHLDWLANRVPNTRSTICIADNLPEDLAGFTRIGAVNVKTYDTARDIFNPDRAYALGCRPAGHCDGKGERCLTQQRSAGCYINDAWLNWYTDSRQEAGLEINEADICRPTDS